MAIGDAVAPGVDAGRTQVGGCTYDSCGRGTCVSWYVCGCGWGGVVGRDVCVCLCVCLCVSVCMCVCLCM